MRALGFIAVLLLSGCACRDPELEPVIASVRVEPTQVDFGRVIVGQVESRTIEVINTGKVALEGTWSITGEGFTSDDATPSRAAVGSTVMTVRCAPPAVGAWDGMVRIALEGYQPIDVPLSCEGAPVPECVPSSACKAAAWDASLGRCVESDRPEGTRCGAGDVCLLDAVCRAGRCEGTPRDCRDSDPCTADTCHPVRGCEHSGPVECPNAGACRVGRCRPGVGCELVDAEDGTPCGPTRSCTIADVCISGQCVQRRPPENFTCVPDGPCGGEGRCVDAVCERTALTTVEPSWRFGGQADGGPPESWSDLFADRDGGLVLSSYFMSPPQLRANSAQPVTLPQQARRCIEWLGWIVCGDYPALQTAPVVALDPATGNQLWSFAGAAQLIPEFAAPRAQYFTARLAVLSESELLVLYESRTFTDAGVDPRCRTYGLAVVDRQGQPLRGRFIDDPIFSVCDHPHSYGLAVDADSNVYLAFTPSGVDNPAQTLVGTTLFSFSPALQLRWRRHLATVTGGELAVANGLLFLEHDGEVRSASTGDPVATLGANFGMGVVGQGLFVSQGDVLQARGVNDFAPRWSQPLPGPVGPSPLSIASLGNRQVILSFSRSTGQVVLQGTDLLTGMMAFQCPVALPDVPVMTALGPGGVGVMVAPQVVTPAWPLCEGCDPRWARTRSQFAWLPLPGLGPSRAPWAGTWGNDGHSHRENR